MSDEKSEEVAQRTCVRLISTSVILEIDCKLFKPPKIWRHECLIMKPSFDTTWKKLIGSGDGFQMWDLCQYQNARQTMTAKKKEKERKEKKAAVLGCANNLSCSLSVSLFLFLPQESSCINERLCTPCVAVTFHVGDMQRNTAGARVMGNRLDRSANLKIRQLELSSLRSRKKNE